MLLWLSPANNMYLGRLMSGLSLIYRIEIVLVQADYLEGRPTRCIDFFGTTGVWTSIFYRLTPITQINVYMVKHLASNPKKKNYFRRTYMANEIKSASNL